MDLSKNQRKVVEILITGGGWSVRRINYEIGEEWTIKKTQMILYRLKNRGIVRSTNVGVVWWYITNEAREAYNAANS